MSTAVIGAGISGLTAAFELAQAGEKVTVFEANDRIGGSLVGSDLGGYAHGDVGAEASLYARPETRELMQQLGLEPQYPSTEHKSQLLVGGQLMKIPAGTLMGVPGRHTDVTGVVSPAGVERLQQEQLNGSQDDPSVGEFIAQRLGAEVVDTLVDPLLAGVYAGSAYHLSLRSTLPALLEAARENTSVLDAVDQILASRRVTQGANIPGTTARPVFVSLDGGMNGLAHALHERCRELGVTFRLGEKVSRVRAGYSLTVSDPQGERAEVADRVLVATPAPVAGQLLGSLGEDLGNSELAGAGAALERVETADSAVVTAVLECASELTGSGFLIPPNEPTFIKASTFASNKWPWLQARIPDGTAVVRMSVGRYRSTELATHTDEQLAQKSVADWMSITGRSDRVLHTEVWRHVGALPQYQPGHAHMVSGVDSVVKRIPTLGLVGNAFEGVGIPACINRARSEVQRLITERTA